MGAMGWATVWNTPAAAGMGGEVGEEPPGQVEPGRAGWREVTVSDHGRRKARAVSRGVVGLRVDPRCLRAAVDLNHPGFRGDSIERMSHATEVSTPPESTDPSARCHPTSTNRCTTLKPSPNRRLQPTPDVSTKPGAVQSRRWGE